MTATIAPAPTEPIPQHIVLHGISWDLYERLLSEIGDRAVRMTFDRGSLEIMSPLPIHELWKKRTARLLETLTLELDLPMQSFGSTTFRRRKALAGLEPDECYYIQHAQDVIGRTEFDFSVDPPPDLAIEVDITSRSVPRQPVYARLGVPEVWHFEARRLSVLLLGRNGRYARASRSKAFPFLPMRTFYGFLRRMESESETAVLREFREWVRTLRP